MTFTPDQRDSMIDAISDMSKDLYGFRMRHDWDLLSDSDLEKLFKDYERDLVADIEREKLVLDMAFNRWEDDIRSYIRLGARDRATAIRWDMQAYGVRRNDVDQYCWERDMMTMESKVREGLRDHRALHSDHVYCEPVATLFDVFKDAILKKAA